MAYLTIDQLIAVIGRDRLVAAAPADPQTDPPSYDASTVQAAIDDVSTRVDAALRSFYGLPLPDVPAFLTRVVAHLVHGELVYEDTTTEVIEMRVKAALKVLEQLAKGELRLGGNLDDDPEVNARTKQGKAILVQPGDRMFRRRDTSGIV